MVPQPHVQAGLHPGIRFDPPCDDAHRFSCGTHPGRHLHLDDVPSIATRVHGADIVVADLRNPDPVNRMSDPVAAEDAFLVDLHLEDHPAYRCWEGGCPAPVGDIRRGDVVLSDLRTDPRRLIDKPFHIVRFYFPRTVFDGLAEEAGVRRTGDLLYRPGQGVHDSRVLHLALLMLAELERPQSTDTAFAGHIALALVTHVAQAYGGFDAPSRPLKGGLAPWQARRAQDLLGANLDIGVDMRDVARECGLSVSHFSRAFRQSTGSAPHGWLVKRRVAAATTMMRDHRLSLCDVALACGFADQSHFTRVFSREMGTSPGAWRRCLER